LSCKRERSDSKADSSLSPRIPVTQPFRMHRYYAYFFPSFPVEKLAVSGWPHLPAPRECERLAEAIGQGGPLQALVARLQERQALAEGLGRQLAAKALQAPTIDRRGLERRIRAKLQDWRTAGAQRRGRPGSAQSAPHRADSLHACAKSGAEAIASS